MRAVRFFGGDTTSYVRALVRATARLRFVLLAGLFPSSMLNSIVQVVARIV